MAPYEGWKSRTERVTIEGHTMTVVWHSTWTDWDAQHASIPRIGDSWNSTRPDMICTDISVDTLSKSDVQCIVTALYTTEGMEARRRENQAASWRESLEVETVESQIDAYLDRTDGKPYSWLAKWIASGTLGGESCTEDNMPVLDVKIPQTRMYITTYGDKAYIQKIRQNVGKINSAAFLTDYSSKKSKGQAHHDDDIDADDTGEWLLEGVKMTRLRAKCWEFNWSFLQADPFHTTSFSNDTRDWNYFYEVAVNLYATYDFRTLLDGMDKYEDEEEVGLYA